MSIRIRQIEHRGSCYDLVVSQGEDASSAEVWRNGKLIGRYKMKEPGDCEVTLDSILSADIQHGIIDHEIH